MSGPARKRRRSDGSPPAAHSHGHSRGASSHGHAETLRVDAQALQGKGAVTYAKPREVGCFSIDRHRVFQDDASQLKAYVCPRMNVPLAAGQAAAHCATRQLPVCGPTCVLPGRPQQRRRHPRTAACNAHQSRAYRQGPARVLRGSARASGPRGANVCVLPVAPTRLWLASRHVHHLCVHAHRTHGHGHDGSRPRQRQRPR